MQALTVFNCRRLDLRALNAYCLMLFCLLYVPCVAKSWQPSRRKVDLFPICLKRWYFKLVVAWLACFIVYQIGHLIF